ncbi:MAG: cytochrome C oxidase subunit IV family protein [Bdellovibrionales bacterium]|nr:cytochrome C oxidase subunit IV family protein [Bdellovibrionales bacterium]
MSEHVDHGPGFYVKTWGILLVLFAISVIGPIAEIRWLTLITAFGVAVVKAYFVAARFMHLDIEKRYINYMFATMLLMMLLFWGGIVADIGAHRGSNWVRIAPSQVQAPGSLSQPKVNAMKVEQSDETTSEEPTIESEGH